MLGLPATAVCLTTSVYCCLSGFSLLIFYLVVDLSMLNKAF